MVVDQSPSVKNVMRGAPTSSQWQRSCKLKSKTHSFPFAGQGLSARHWRRLKEHSHGELPMPLFPVRSILATPTEPPNSARRMERNRSNRRTICEFGNERPAALGKWL